MSDIAPRVIGVIAENQKIDPAKIQLESTFEELEIDSFDGVNLLFALENEFDISIPDTEAPAMRSVQDVVRGVTQLVEAKTGEAAGESARESA